MKKIPNIITPPLESINDTTPKQKVINMLHNMQDIVQKTLISAQNYKDLNILTANDLNYVQESLRRIYNEICLLDVQVKIKIDEALMTKIQTLTLDISNIIRNYGTKTIEDLLYICLGADYIETHIAGLDSLTIDKFNLIKKYSRPIGYKNEQNNHLEQQNNETHINKKRVSLDPDISKNTTILDTFDLTRTTMSFIKKVRGIKIAFCNPAHHKILVVTCIVDDIMIECIGSVFLSDKIDKFNTISQNCEDKDKQSFIRLVQCITLKDFLVYSEDDIRLKFSECHNQTNIIKQTAISQVAKDFIVGDLYLQRNILLQLLIRANEHEFQYLAYLLFDLMAIEINGQIDTRDQTILFDSLPWNCKRFFRDAMKQTVQYTNSLTKYDSSKIPLEQQICLLNASVSVKEKAMVKLKEVKAKSDESGAKARQYLEGLLRIPFGVHRNEPILNKMSENNAHFLTIVQIIQSSGISITGFPIKTLYTNLEVRKFIPLILTEYMPILKEIFSRSLIVCLTTCKRDIMVSNIHAINSIIKRRAIICPQINHSGKTVKYMRDEINTFIESNCDSSKYLLEIAIGCDIQMSCIDTMSLIESNIKLINENTTRVEEYMKEVNNTLNNAVHGHDKAKRQIERIIGQWINGDRGGYCFGFEGPPGVGKTSLAKNGIAQCLKDNDKSNRPFAFIAIGGASNSCTIDGHNYTYVGSSWGRIVDILIESKCMNPIIFIDELDKVSKSEHGKEIIGILTHLIDPTQNSAFQDKYFSGIDLDLSKALFIFSYNDVTEIDSILLDRIHRIKFDHLTNKDKLIITRKYLLPELLEKMGQVGMIEISDEIVLHIIREYTCEPGVRKLKELLFEIVGEINLTTLKNLNNDTASIPFIITMEDINSKYLKDIYEFTIKKIHPEPKIGIITGLWANCVGQGGILPIEGSWMPTTTFLELKLTGMQGDVMKESMNVAKTLSYNLASEYIGQEKMIEFIAEKEKTKLQGIHVHVPEGSTPKDGPSAGAAITVVVYSLITKRKIKNKIAITGEICLSGDITAIGGLELKILGGISSGVKTFIYPKENSKDFLTFVKKHSDNNTLEGIAFIEVSNIQDVLDIVFVD